MRGLRQVPGRQLRKTPRSKGVPQALKPYTLPKSGRSKYKHLAQASITRRHVLVVGAGSNADQLQAELRAAGIVLRRVSSLEECPSAISVLTAALVIVPPTSNVSIEDFCTRFRVSNDRMPVFVSTQGRPGKTQLRLMYLAGVTAVFEWAVHLRPLERALDRVVAADVDSMPLGRAREIALEEKVNARLRSDPETRSSGLFAHVRDRLALIAGSVDAAWRAEKARRVARGTLGIRDADAGAVEVSTPQVPDLTIANEARGALKRASGVDPRTLAVSVENGRASVAGTFASRAELTRTLALVRRIPGVRNVENYATVSPDSKRRERETASRLKRVAKGLLPESRVDVSVFGGVAVLSGLLKERSARKRLIAAFNDHPEIRKVIDKLRLKRSSNVA